MKPEKFKPSELGTLTPLGSVAACWECKQEFLLFDSAAIHRHVMKHGRSYWLYYSSASCPLCQGDMSRYDTPEQLKAAKARRQERAIIEESEAERLHAENAGLKVRLRDALQQITLLQAELRRSEASRQDALRELADMRQKAFPMKERAGATCPQCGERFYQEETGRRARFCSNLCRLHFHRETKRNARNVSTQKEGKQI